MNSIGLGNDWIRFGDYIEGCFPLLSIFHVLYVYARKSLYPFNFKRIAQEIRVSFAAKISQLENNKTDFG